MGYLSRRRGVISVFLLIIFMITYVFMGMLVDAGRYRMAEAYMESALDSASNSVLSNYNDLVFDLYGLFSVDTKLEEGQSLEAAIMEKYSHYLKETLEMVDATEYETMLAQLVKGDRNQSVISTQSLYDFEITGLKAGSSITLADPLNVESQIIEYMKFRAPTTLVDRTEGFLNKLNTIVEMKDRVEEALNKETIKNKYETDKNGNIPLSEQAANLLGRINDFACVLYNYTVAPHKEYSELEKGSIPLDVYSNNPYDVWDYVEAFDAALNDAESNYWNRIGTENENYRNNLANYLSSLQDAMIEAAEEAEEGDERTEIYLDNAYETENGESTTRVFTKIKLPISLSELEKLDELAWEAYSKIKSSSDEWCMNYIGEFYSEAGRHSKEVANAKVQYEMTVTAAKNTLNTNISNLENNAKKIYEWDKDLVQDIQNTVARYESYKEELKAAMGDNPDDNKVTVYATEIELAEANMGELLKNLDLLANARAYLDSLGYGFKNENGNRNLLSINLINLAGKIVNNYMEPNKTRLNEKPLEVKVKITTKYKSSSDAVNLYQNGYEASSIPYMLDDAEIAKNILPEYQNHVCVLYSHVSYFHTGHYRVDVDVIIDDTTNTDAEDISKMEVDSEKDSKAAEKNATVDEQKTTQDGTSISLDSDKAKAEMLKVNYSYTAQVDERKEIDAEINVEGEVTSESISNILSTGLELIESVGTLLEKSRDNLYVNAYVMSTFPNYKEHYKGYDTAKSSYLLSNGRDKYLASYAEVEFIVTGAGANGKTVVEAGAFAENAKGFGNMSVWSMRTRLFGTRMLFNSISMLTDSAKMQQASALSSWAGPLAPLVAAVLVICWIIAESVVDVMILMGDIELETHAKNGEIPIFKQSGDWLFSLNGVATKVANLAVNKVSEQILDKAEDLTASAQQKANVMIYKAYNSIDSGISTVDEAVSSAVKEGKEQLTEWGGELQDNINNAMQDVTDKTSLPVDELNDFSGQLSGFSDALDTAVEEKDKYVEVARSVTSDAKEQAVLAVTRVGDKVMDTTKNFVDKAGTDAKNFIASNISKVVPIGTVVNSSKSDITMGYTDYLYFFLFIMNQETKVKRIQAVIQANMQVGGEDNFMMESAPVAVWADLECNMKFMFMSNVIVPESMKKDGRLRLKVISAQSY